MMYIFHVISTFNEESSASINLFLYLCTANLCVPNPCLNEGLCVPLGNTFQCICERGYSGINCESKLDKMISELVFFDSHFLKSG